MYTYTQNQTINYIILLTNQIMGQTHKTSNAFDIYEKYKDNIILFV